MRGLFMIVKGTYTHDKGPTFFNPVTQSKNWLGGYNPEDPTTEDWWICVDRITFTCQAGGSDFNKVVGAVSRMIKKYKTLGNYLRVMEKINNERYYDPKTDSVLQNKGCSSMMVELYKEIDERWGYYYSEEIEEQEDLAYEFLRENQPYKKAQKKMKKIGLSKVETKPEKVGNQTKEVKFTKVNPIKRKSIKRLYLT